MTWLNSHSSKTCKTAIPLPGIEPGSPGWKPDILTVGLQRSVEFSNYISIYIFGNGLKNEKPKTWDKLF